MRTHYDNLQIPRDADEQTIRQAYRRLSKQYHPDLNPSEDASRIMQLINRAYAVLSDPEQRAEHDRWIRQQETLRIQNIQAKAVAAPLHHRLLRPCRPVFLATEQLPQNPSRRRRNPRNAA